MSILETLPSRYRIEMELRSTNYANPQAPIVEWITLKRGHKSLSFKTQMEAEQFKLKLQKTQPTAVYRIEGGI